LFRQGSVNLLQLNTTVTAATALKSVRQISHYFRGILFKEPPPLPRQVYTNLFLTKTPFGFARLVRYCLVVLLLLFWEGSGGCRFEVTEKSERLRYRKPFADLFCQCLRIFPRFACAFSRSCSFICSSFSASFLTIWINSSGKKLFS
jgi:hypothetical protein